MTAKTFTAFNHEGANYQCYAEYKRGVWRNVHIHSIFVGSNGVGHSRVTPSEALLREARKQLGAELVRRSEAA